MIATINGVTLQGSTAEMLELISALQKKDEPPVAIPQTALSKEEYEALPDVPVNTEPVRSVAKPTGEKSLIKIPGKSRGHNPYGGKGQKVWTISMINGAKIEYANQSLCARALGVNQTKISQRKDTQRPVSGYYITTKKPL